MKESMAKKGYVQGDMAPKVEDYQAPESVFPERGFSKTLEYVERQNKFRAKESADIKKQGYQGRYS